MKSKIRVEYDFDKKEPYIQIYHELDGEGTSDLRDVAFKNFTETANNTPMCLVFPKAAIDNSCPQIRLITKESCFENQMALLGCFSNLCKGIINKTYPDSQEHPRKVFAEFFEMMDGILRIHLNVELK